MNADEEKKVTKAAKAMARGSLYIFIGNTSATVVQALVSVMVARLLAPEGYGLYCLTLVVPSFFLTFTDFGTNSALLKFLPKSREDGSTSKLIKAGLLFSALISLSLSIFAFFFSGSMAQWFLNRSDIGSFVQIATPLIFFQAIIATSNSAFIGLSESKYTAAVSVLQAVARFAFVFLVVSGFGLFGAILSNALSYFLACVMALLFLMKLYKTHSRIAKNFHFTKSLAPMLSYGFPIYSSAFLMSLFARYQSAVLAWHTSDIEIGNYNIAQNFTSLVTVLTFPISATLLPSFSKLDKEKSDLKKFYDYSVKYTLLIAVPASFLVAVTSRDLVQLFYGPKYSMAPAYLTIFILTFSYSAFTIVLGNLFNGTGEVNVYFKVILAKLITSLPLTFILTSHLRVFGLIASSAISDLVLLVYAYQKARIKYDIRTNVKGLLTIFLASILSASAVLLFRMEFSVNSSLVNLLLNGTVFLVFFLILSPLLGAIEREDISNLRVMFQETHLASLVEKVLYLYEHLTISLRILK